MTDHVSDKKHSDTDQTRSVDSDEQQLQRLGFKQQLHRSLGVIESFGSGFCTVDSLSGVRVTFFLGVLAGGPLALWTSYLIAMVCITITAAVIAEVCSALPVSGSLYIWAAVAAGPRYGRFVGFVVAWWAAAAWMTFAAVSCQATANFILSLFIVYDVEVPGGISNDNAKWRTVVWIVSEGFLALAVALNFIPPRWFTYIFRVSMSLMFLDFMLCVVWLPIGASKTYGLRNAHDAFIRTYNGIGAPPGWNWMLSFFISNALVGWDAAGHIAEETKDASTVAARNIFRSAVAVCVGGAVALILFLFCTPDITTLFSLSAPQPFVLIYSMALGRGGSVVMTALASVQLFLGTTFIILTTSRLIYAIARDGALPFSSWVAEVAPSGVPRNAVLVMWGTCAILICAILPSAAAFTSLVSGGVVPLVASYGLIALLRLTVTPDGFKASKFSLGRVSKPFYVISVIFNAVLFAVNVSPFVFPVTAQTLNFGGIIFSVVTLFGVITFWLTPEERWLCHEQIQQMYDGANGSVSSL